MTMHEILRSLLWLVAGSYTAYLTWFATQSIRNRFSHHSNRNT
jgi:hypothetical protein